MKHQNQLTSFSKDLGQTFHMKRIRLRIPKNQAKKKQFISLRKLRWSSNNIPFSMTLVAVTWFHKMKQSNQLGNDH